MRWHVLGAVAACALGVAVPSAAATTATTLTVTVSPATVHPSAIYSVTIAGRYNKHALRRTPSLLAFIQYTGSACRASAIAEYQLPTSEWSWVFYPQRPERNSAFSEVVYKRARTRLGQRHVCAYLYAHTITPTSTAKPIAVASASFRNVKG